MATVNDSFGDSKRADLIDEGRDADAMTVDRDLNRIFAGTVRRPPPPLSKKKLSEAKKEFRGTPQRGVGLTVVMALAVAVGLFGLCVWTLLDKVQDATSNGASPPAIAAMAYNKPLSTPPDAAPSAPAPAAAEAAPSVSPPSPPVRASLPAPVITPPVIPAASSAPIQAPPVYAKAQVNVAPIPVPRPQAAPAALPVRAPVLAKAAPAPAPAAAPKALPQLAYNKVSPPRPTSQGSASADAMLRSLAAQPIKASAGVAPIAATSAGGTAKACNTAEDCGSYGLVQAADMRLTKAFNAAVEAGVSQELLADVKGRWSSLRSDTSRPPGMLLADYGGLARSLWRARDQALGPQRGANDQVVSK